MGAKRNMGEGLASQQEEGKTHHSQKLIIILFDEVEDK
jgi:hypothetical protein